MGFGHLGKVNVSKPPNVARFQVWCVPVRTRREKELGETPVWYRRSRYVAREYAWLSERSDLFSPASTASTSFSNRILPILYLQHEEDENDPRCMCSLDISDAYLTVRQSKLVRVSHEGRSFILGRPLHPACHLSL